MSEFNEESYNKSLDLALWKKLIKYILPHKKTLLVIAIAMMSTAAVDAVFPLMTKRAIDNFVVPGQTNGLGIFALNYAGLVLLQGLNVWVFIAFAGKLEVYLAYDIRKVGFERLQELSFSYYDKKAVGWLMARMTSDIRKLGQIISWGFVDVVWGLIMMVFMFLLMLIHNVWLTLVTVSVMPVMFIVSVYFQKRILAAYRKVRKTNSKITGSFNEGITGAKTTKTLVREEENLDEFSSLTNDMRSSSIRAAILSALYFPIVLTLGSVGTGLALYFGGRGVFLENIDYGTLVLFLSYTTLFFEPVFQLARVFAEFQNAQASAERTLSMIETEPEIQDSEEIIEKYGDSFNPKRETWPELRGNITFQNVSFYYTEEEKVLKDFNLEVKSGETIALVGETGSGKSTIVNLLCRFYEPVKGKVLIDGVDYRERSQSWLHEHLGYVLQSPHLFSGTIRENIAYGKLDASDEEIVAAARLVNAHNFISKLEKGYDTEVGEGGGLLSTGEKQLISFARAVIANPRIFVLDEATSSIDTEMERIIQEAINNILEGRTNFIIAHRLSTIQSADRILVVKDGRVIEEGNHQELMKNEGYYYKLYTNQFMEEMQRTVS
ncbi:ABC transporter ATP-binding protein [Natronospora cellulosivora (SeqCode)]